MNTSACARNESVNRQVSRAAAAPTANQTEVMLKVEASNSRKSPPRQPAREMEQGSWFSLLMPYYRVSPGWKVKCFLLERCAENEIKNKINEKQCKM